MAVLSEAIRANLKISYGEDAWDYTVSGLNPEANGYSLLLLAEAVSLFQGLEPLDLVSRNEYRLVSN